MKSKSTLTSKARQHMCAAQVERGKQIRGFIGPIVIRGGRRNRKRRLRRRHVDPLRGLQALALARLGDAVAVRNCMRHSSTAYTDVFARR